MAVIGLGLLGAAVSARLRRAGCQLHGFDPNPRRMSMARRLGVTLAPDAAAVAGCSVVFLALPHSGISEEVIREIEASLAPEAVVFDCTTGEPAQMAALGQRLARRRRTYLDTTVLGSSAEVREGTALIMVGGPRRAFVQHRALFEQLARETFYLGKCGSAARMKLVVNLVLGLNRAALAEALTFAQKIGVDPRDALKIMRAGAAYSRVMDVKGLKMIRRDFAPQARLAQHLKDVRLMLAQASAGEFELPLTTQHAALLERAVALGAGDLDNSAVLLAYA